MRTLTPLLSLAVVLAACDRAEVQAAAQLEPPVALERLTITLEDGDRRWTWAGVDFRTTSELAIPHTRARPTRTRGDLLVSFVLADLQQAVAAEGSVTIPLRSDWRWTIHFWNSTVDPRDLCFGCVASRAFALPLHLRAPGRDSLWVVWGGNFISDPVVF